MTSHSFLCFLHKSSSTCDNRHGDVCAEVGVGSDVLNLPLWSRRLMHVSVFCLELGRRDV